MSLFLYIILLISAALFYPLYENDLSFAVLAALLILPVMMLIQIAVTVRELKVLSKSGDTVAHKGERGGINVDIINGSPFAVSELRLRVRTRTSPWGIDDKKIIDASVGASSRIRSVIETDTSHYGVTDLYLDSMEVRDVLGLFRWKVKTHGRKLGSLFVIPRIDEEYRPFAEGIVNAVNFTEDDDGEKTVTTGPGEVIDFRDFMEGDRTVHIHHKLSARFDKDIVKVMGTDDVKPFLFIPLDEDGMDPDTRDRIIERTLNIAYFVGKSGQGAFAEVLSGGIPTETEIKDEESFNSAAMLMAVSAFPYPVPVKGYICCVTGSEEEADYVSR